MFRSTGSYEPDRRGFRNIVPVVLFRSTGSYEPDRGVLSGITTVAGFDPQALTSLTLKLFTHELAQRRFRSTGSYEPDRYLLLMETWCIVVSIHRLLRA